MTRNITLRESEFNFVNSKVGEETIVAKHQVPPRTVFGVDNSRPLAVAFSSKYTEDAGGASLSVNEGTTTTIDFGADLDKPDVPQVAFMDNIVNGQYTDEANLVIYFDSDGDGEADTLVTDSTTVQYASVDTDVGEDGDVQAVTLEDTSTNSGSKAIEIVAVQKQGQLKVRKTASGASRVSQTLKKASERTFVYSAPDNPEADTQTYYGSVAGQFGAVIPPKFQVDLVFYDNDEQVVPAEADVENVHISLPFRQRQIRQGEDASELRRRVRNDMVNNS